MLKKIVTLAMAAVMAIALVACGNTASEPVDLAAFGEKYVTEKVVPSLLDTETDMGKDVMEMSFPGLSEIETQQCLLYVSVMSMSNGEMVLVQTNNSDDVAKVKEVLQARIDSKLAGFLYPSETEIWTNNAEIVENGNYVALVVSEDKDTIVEEFNALFQ